MQPIRYALTATLLLSAGHAAAQSQAPVAPSEPPPIPHTEATYELSAVEVPPRIANRAQVGPLVKELFEKAVGPQGGRGAVTLRFVVNPDGTTARAIVVVPNENPAIDEAALTALRAMRFTPAQIYQRNVRVLVDLPLPYDVPPRKTRGAPTPAPSNR
jgi:protein TonB